MFITVEVADREVEAIHVDDISRVKAWDVFTTRKGEGKTVRGCILERRSQEHAVWSVEPQRVVLERINAVAPIEGSLGWAP